MKSLFKKINFQNLQFRKLILGILILPLQEKADWQLEKYSKLPPHEVNFSKSGMEVKVTQSASPIFYSFKRSFKIKGFKISGDFKGLPHFEKVEQQGSSGFDDYPLGIGLIVPGSKKLDGVKKFFAADWVKRLYSQVPKDMGIDHVQFYNWTQNPKLVGTSRTHPKADLIKQDFISLVNSPGSFTLQYKLPKIIPAFGLWISIDGDDTKSNFTVNISNFEIEYADE